MSDGAGLPALDATDLDQAADRLPEAGVRLWRYAITAIFGRWIDEHGWSEADTRRVVQLVARDNARRVYGLP